MKKAALALLASGAFLAICAFTLAPAGGPDYVGAKSCKGCHNAAKGGKVYAEWEKSSHAKAFETLKTAEADKIATEKGYKTKAAETDFCLSCHVTGMLEEGASFDKKFNKDEGVGCEACHGAGGKYKMKHAKGIEEADGTKLGMQFPKIADGSAEKQCKMCHNEKSPTYKPFKMKEKWAEIKHGLK
jgi:Cytochrome c554 and c-prime